MRVSVEKRANGQPYLRLVSTQSVDEPFLDMLVELTSASGRLLREFPILLDPPGVGQKWPPLRPLPRNRCAPLLPRPLRRLWLQSPRLQSPPLQRPRLRQLPRKQLMQRRHRTSLKALASVQRPGRRLLGNYTVQQDGDTLSAIASRNKPAGVNLDQMLVSLFRENQSAFIDNNMNRIRVGQILRVPGAEEAKVIPEPKRRKKFVRSRSILPHTGRSLPARSSGAEPWRHRKSDSQRQDRQCGR